MRLILTIVGLAVGYLIALSALAPLGVGVIEASIVALVFVVIGWRILRRRPQQTEAP